MRKPMIMIRALLLAAASLALASPALAGSHFYWWQYRYAEAPWHYVCGAFEARHKCNAEFRHHRCGCLVR